jgi:hypothetical protein
MNVNGSRSKLILALLAIIAALQVATVAMVGHAYWTARNTISAMRSAFGPPHGAQQTIEIPSNRAGVTNAARPLPPAVERKATASDLLELISVRSDVTEKNSSWWKYSWVATIRNKSVETVSFALKVDFLDESGYVVDDDRTTTLTIEPGETRDFTGYDLVTAGGPAERVTRVSAAVALR